MGRFTAVRKSVKILESQRKFLHLVMIDYNFIQTYCIDREREVLERVSAVGKYHMDDRIYLNRIRTMWIDYKNITEKL